MPIPNFLVPNINVGATCTNCAHRHTASDYKRCVSCRDHATGDKPFPLHEVEK